MILRKRAENEQKTGLNADGTKKFVAGTSPKKEKYIFFRKDRGVWVFRYRGTMRSFPTKTDALIERARVLAAVKQDGTDCVLPRPQMLEYLRAKELAGETPLDDVVKAWRELTRPKDVPDCGHAIDAWLERQRAKGVSVSSVKLCEFAARKIFARFHALPLRDVTASLLVDWSYEMEGLAPRTRRNIVACAVQWLRFCARRGWIERAPEIERSELAREAPGSVGVLTLAQARELFAVVAAETPQFLPHFALRAFAGLRTAEAQRMRWEWIDFEARRIVVPAEICKTRDRHVLQAPSLPDAVFRRLEPFRKAEGAIPFPANVTWRARILSKLSFAWSKNALRHTFCTMHVTLRGEAATTAELLRHKSPRMLYSNYLGEKATLADAQAYFGDAW